MTETDSFLIFSDKQRFKKTYGSNRVGRIPLQLRMSAIGINLSAAKQPKAADAIALVSGASHHLRSGQGWRSAHNTGIYEHVPID